MNETIGKINKYLISPDRFSSQGILIPAQYNYSFDVNESYKVANNSSMATKEYVDQLNKNIKELVMGRLPSHFLNKNAQDIDAALDLRHNSLTDTDDSSLTGKALDQLVYNTSNQCGNINILIQNASDSSHNGIWKLTSFKGKSSQISTIPVGCCYIINDKIHLKENEKEVNQMCFTLDHSVSRTNEKYEYVNTNISVSATQGIDISNLPARFCISDDDITQYHTVQERVYDTISTRIALVNKIETKKIVANDADILNLTVKNITINGTNLLDRLNEIESLLKKK